MGIVSETAVPYLSQSSDICATVDDKPTRDNVEIDWEHIERMLIPVLNIVRKNQGKKPIIVPRG